MRPVRVVGYAEPRGSLHTAPGCSGPLPASITVAYGRLRHEIASSRCTSGAARRPVTTVQVPPDISTIGPDDVSGRRAQLLHAVRPRRYHGDVRTLHSGRLADSARCWAQRWPAWSAGPQRPCRSRVDTLGLRSSSLRRSKAGGALRVCHGVTSRPVNMCPAAADDVLGCHPPECSRAAADKLGAARTAADRPSA